MAPYSNGRFKASGTVNIRLGKDNIRTFKTSKHLHRSLILVIVWHDSTHQSVVPKLINSKAEF